MNFKISFNGGYIVLDRWELMKPITKDLMRFLLYTYPKSPEAQTCIISKVSDTGEEYEQTKIFWDGTELKGKPLREQTEILNKKK